MACRVPLSPRLVGDHDASARRFLDPDRDTDPQQSPTGRVGEASQAHSDLLLLYTIRCRFTVGTVCW